SIPVLEAAASPWLQSLSATSTTSRAISEGPALMKQTARSWRVTVAGLAVGAAGVLGLASPTASADPVFPPRPNPAPAAPMPQAVAVVPGAVGNPMPGTAAAPPAPISPALAPPPPALPAPRPVAAPPELTPASSGTLR